MIVAADAALATNTRTREPLAVSVTARLGSGVTSVTGLELEVHARGDAELPSVSSVVPLVSRSSR